VRVCIVPPALLGDTSRAVKHALVPNDVPSGSRHSQVRDGAEAQGDVNIGSAERSVQKNASQTSFKNFNPYPA
jgi:hypothetical protein